MDPVEISPKSLESSMLFLGMMGSSFCFGVLRKAAPLLPGASEEYQLDSARKAVATKIWGFATGCP